MAQGSRPPSPSPTAPSTPRARCRRCWSRRERIAATVILGVHGRKRAGPGESFWQYRPYSFGDSTQRIDWHNSARSDRVFIRENEWEAANTLWLWPSPSVSMDFPLASRPRSPSATAPSSSPWRWQPGGPRP